MNANLRVHGAYVSLASVVAMAFVATTHGCTTEVNNVTDGGGSSSSGSGSSSGSSSSSSSSSGSSSGSSSSSSGSGGVDSGPMMYTCVAPGPTTIPVEAGTALIPPTTAHAAGGDASPPFNVQWGTFSPFGAGTYLYPNDGTTGGPAAPGSIADVISDAASTCTTLGSQNTFTANYTLATNSWHLTGTVGTYSGVGMYLNPCLDGTMFTGIEFTVQGSVGDEQVSDAGDGGTTGGLMQFIAAQDSNNAINTGGTAGTCNPQITTCTPAFKYFPVTSTPQVITIFWTDLGGGSPTTGLDTPSRLARFGWQYVWPCMTNPTAYATDVTISNIHLISQ